MQSLSRTETLLLCACAALLGLALVAPALPNPEHYHAFADRRAFFRIPFAMDVLSNLSFALMGAWGLWALRGTACAIGSTRHALARLFFAGLLVTAAGSTWYHLQPDDAGLVIDRGGMAFAFAGLLGLAAAERVSERAGHALASAVLVLALASVYVWSVTGNVTPWAVLQFGGMALIATLACVRGGNNALNPSWALVIAAYATAKVFELQDHAVFHLTHGIVSGHTLKHVFAALAAAPVVLALRAPYTKGHNAAHSDPKALQGRGTVYPA